MEDKEKGKYTKSEKYLKAKESQVKFSQYEATNSMLTTFCESGEVTEVSLFQYRSAIRRCEEIYDKPIIDVTIEEIESYAEGSSNKIPTQKAQRNYIKGFLRFWVVEEIKKGNKIVDLDKFLYLFLDSKTGITIDLAKQYIM